MMETVFFVGGIHGVGKTVFSNCLRKSDYDVVINASDLLNRTSHDKTVDNVEINQQLILNKVLQQRSTENLLILLGHYCVLNRNYEIIRINYSFFKQLNPGKLFLLLADSAIIQKRLREKYFIDWGISFIDEFQQTEKLHAQEISKQLDVTLGIYSR